MKIKHFRAGRGDATTVKLTTDLAERTDADLIEPRGNTATNH